MSANAIPSSRAKQLTHDRVIEILELKLSSELDSELSRSGNFVDGGSGVFLPDPNRLYRQALPTQRQMHAIDQVELFSGPRADTAFGDYENRAGGRILDVDVPWACSIFFAKAPSQDVSDPAQGRDLTDAERMQRRADYYADVLKHTIEKWGKLGSATKDRAKAVRSVTSDSDLATTITIGEYDGDSQELRGVAIYEFTISHKQEIPPISTT